MQALHTGPWQQGQVLEHHTEHWVGVLRKGLLEEAQVLRKGKALPTDR